MDINNYDADFCIITRMVKLISGKWKPLILYLVYNDVNRFGILKKNMPKISKKVLTEQLRELELDNLVSREVVIASFPKVVVYSLTDKGISFRNLIGEMFNWGITNLEIEGSSRNGHEHQFKSCNDPH